MPHIHWSEELAASSAPTQRRTTSSIPHTYQTEAQTPSPEPRLNYGQNPRIPHIHHRRDALLCLPAPRRTTSFDPLH